MPQAECAGPMAGLGDIKINVKDEFSLKNEVFLSKNVIFVYKGKYSKIHRKLGGLISNIYHENASVIKKMPFNYTYRSQKTKYFVKLKMRFSNYRSILMVNVVY